MASLKEHEDLLQRFKMRGEIERQQDLKGIYPMNWNGISRQSDWTDEMFFTKYYKPAASKLRKVIDLDTSVNIAKFFLSLYLGCIDLPENTSLEDIYFSLLPSIKIKGKSIFDIQQATEEQLSISPPSTEVSSYQFLKCSLPQKNYKTPNGVVTFSARNINQWFNNIIAAAEDQSKKQHFINMVGFIMLNMLWLLRNEDESLDKHLPLGCYRDSMRMLNSFQEIKEFPFPPPHDKFYKMFHRYLTMSHASSKHILAILVQSYTTSKDVSVLNFLNAACLEHFYGHGIGAINWSSKLGEKTKMDLNDVLSCFRLEVTSTSVEKVKIFKSTVQPMSWPWSRFFDDAAYYSLSTAKNVRFCLICAYAVINDHYKIPTMPQFRKVPNFLFNWASEQAENVVQSIQQKNTGSK